jgi:pumilio family protein 6
VIEMAYNEYACAGQRNSLIQEFYGSEFALFKAETSAPQSLEEVLAASPDHRGRILQHMKDSLVPLLEK